MTEQAKTLEHTTTDEVWFHLVDEENHDSAKLSIPLRSLTMPHKPASLMSKMVSEPWNRAGCGGSEGKPLEVVIPSNLIGWSSQLAAAVKAYYDPELKEGELMMLPANCELSNVLELFEYLQLSLPSREPEGMMVDLSLTSYASRVRAAQFLRHRRDLRSAYDKLLNDLLESKRPTSHYFAIDNEQVHKLDYIQVQEDPVQLFSGPEVERAVHFSWAQKPKMRAMMVSVLTQIGVEATWQQRHLQVKHGIKTDIWVLTVSVPDAKPTLRQQKQEHACQTLKRQRS